MLIEIVTQLVIGAVVGIGAGYAGRALMARLQLVTGGLYPALMLAFGFLSFGVATLIEGSGFLAVYVTGIVLGNGPLPYRAGLLRIFDALAWLAQIGMFLLLGLLVFPSRLGEVAGLEAGLATIREQATQLAVRPRVFFEEWDDPLISGIQWVEELVEIAGGDPVFPERRHARLAKDRIVSSDEVISAAPDVIIGSWCGKPVRIERIVSRPGWVVFPAVRAGHIYEVKSAFILQPGPAALTEGVRQLPQLLERAVH
jgi:hypothetical protein